MRHKTQDPKYDIETKDGFAYLVNAATGKPIPRDMPIFIFLAKDRKAVTALYNYRNDCENEQHISVVEARIEEFEQYALTHSGEMKEPDTTPNASVKGGAE